MSKHLWFWGLAALVVLGRGILWKLMPMTCEDSYITFRYAENMAKGLGLVYNPGEKVMGFTSLPWTLWCSLGAVLGAQLEHWSRATSLACDLATMTMLWKALPTVPARCFGVMFALLAPFAGISMTGMESSTFLCSIVAAGLYRKWWLIALVAVMRPEGVLVAVVLAWWLSWRHRMYAGLAISAVYGTALIYYGTAFAQSVTAKAAIYGVHPLSNRVWWEWFLPFLGYQKALSMEGTWLTFLRVLILPAAILGAISKGPHRPLALALASVWLAYIATGTAYFSWYFLIPLACAVLLASIGIPKIIRSKVAYACLLATLVLTWESSISIYFHRFNTENQAFTKAAHLLRQIYKPGESILLEPIGIIGHRTSLRVIDEIGLVSPNVIQERKKGPGWYSRILHSHHPDWLLFRSNMDSSAFSGSHAPLYSILDLAPYDTVAASGHPDNPATLILMRKR